MRMTVLMNKTLKGELNAADFWKLNKHPLPTLAIDNLQTTRMATRRLEHVGIKKTTKTSQRNTEDAGRRSTIRRSPIVIVILFVI